MQLIVKLSDTHHAVSLPSERLCNYLQFYVNSFVDLSGRIDWSMLRSRVYHDYERHLLDDSEYLAVLGAICDLCNFDSLYPFVF